MGMGWRGTGGRGWGRVTLKQDISRKKHSRFRPTLDNRRGAARAGTVQTMMTSDKPVHGRRSEQLGPGAGGREAVRPFHI